jgi:hypothetical protein
MYVVHSPARVSKGDLLMVRQAHHERKAGLCKKSIVIFMESHTIDEQTLFLPNCLAS